MVSGSQGRGFRGRGELLYERKCASETAMARWAAGYIQVPRAGQAHAHRCCIEGGEVEEEEEEVEDEEVEDEVEEE